MWGLSRVWWIRRGCLSGWSVSPGGAADKGWGGGNGLLGLCAAGGGGDTRAFFVRTIDLDYI